LGTRPWFGERLTVSRAGTVFNKTSEMVDDKVKDQLSPIPKWIHRVCQVLDWQSD
jgi:hypothetical protein